MSNEFEPDFIKLPRLPRAILQITDPEEELLQTIFGKFYEEPQGQKRRESEAERRLREFHDYLEITRGLIMSGQTVEQLQSYAEKMIEGTNIRQTRVD